MRRYRIGIGEGIEMKKIVTLLRPPIISSRNSFSAPVTPPLALAYLTAVLERAGIEVDPIDAVGEDITHLELQSETRRMQGMSLESIVKRIHPDTDILGISIMFSQEWPVIKQLITMIREAHPHLVIIGGGEHVTALPEFSLTDCPALDYCGMGEGEDILLDFVQTVRSDGDLSKVAGLFYRDNQRLFQQRHENGYGKWTIFHGLPGIDCLLKSIFPATTEWA